MNPETDIQRKIQQILKKRGWIVLRVGVNGLPDIIALHPKGRGIGWVEAKERLGGRCETILWKGALRSNNAIIPVGVKFNTECKESKMFLEVKTAMGVRNPRQEFYIRYYESFGSSLFVDDVFLSSLVNTTTTDDGAKNSSSSSGSSDGSS